MFDILRDMRPQMSTVTTFCAHRQCGVVQRGAGRGVSDFCASVARRQPSPHGRQRPRSHTKTRERVWVVANLVWWLAPARLTGLRV